MGVVGQQVDDGDVGHVDHALEHVVVVDAGRHHPVVALQDARDVLDRLAGVEADLLAARVDGVPAELHDGHLGGVAGARRRLLEDERRARTLQRPAEVGGREDGEIEDRADLGRRSGPRHRAGGGTRHGRRRLAR